MAKHDKTINIEPKISYTPFWTTTSEQRCWHHQGSYKIQKGGMYMTYSCTRQ